MAPPRDVPLLPTQQQLLFLSRLEGPESSSYNEAVLVRLSGPLRIDALERAFSGLVERHEALRTSVDLEGECQRIHPTASLPLERCDLPAQTGVEAARDPIAAACHRPFDLGRAPLARALLLREGRDAHRLLFTAHDLVVDGISLGVLFGDLLELYQAACSGVAFHKPPALQLSEYAEWRLARQDARLEAGRAFWRERLEGRPPFLELPWDAPRVASPVHAGRRETLHVPADLLRRLRAAARAESTSLFGLLLAAFTALLHRLSASPELVVGIRSAVRGVRGGASLVANTTNTLPIASELRSTTRFSEHAARTRREVLAALAHADVPFPTIVRDLNPPREGGQAPLASVCFNLNPGFDPPRLPALRAQMLDLPMQRGRLDLDVNATLVDGALRIDAEYDAAIARGETIASWLRAYENLLEEVCVERGRPVAELPLLRHAEIEALVAEGRGPDRALPAGGLWSLFARRCREHPEAPAARDGSACHDYAELEARASRLGSRLRELGVGPETVVGVFGERSVEMLVAMLGTSYAGAAFLLLDPRWPASRRNRALRRAGVRMVLTIRGATCVDVDATCIPCADATSVPCAGPGERPLYPSVSGGEHALAYVIFTSGSTGEPKGALLEQSGMLNHLFAKVDDLGLGPGDVVVQNAPQSFDVCIWQFLAPLLAGGCVEIVDEDVTRDPELLVATVARGVSVLEVVPTFLRELVSFLEDAPEPIPLPSLRWLVVTGEALPQDVCARWARIAPSVPIVNAYGPTECSDDVTHAVIAGAGADASAIAPIGRPLANTRAVVVGAHGDVLQKGVPGELWIAGAGVGRGYLNDPARTRESFVWRALGADVEARFYRTGDRARWDVSTGELRFLGRLDDQVKVRGHRIELGEIESRLREHAEVLDAVAAVEEGRLVAFVVARGTPGPDERALCDHVAERLPRYMVPAIGRLDAIPRSANGKVDRSALPRLEREVDPAATFEPTGGPVESALAAVWQQVLGVDRVSASDNFFELGGDSIRALQVVGGARRRGIRISARLVLERQTLRELAAAAHAAPALVAEQGRLEGRAELMPMQRWFLRRHRHPNHWNQACRIEVSQRIDPAILARALGALQDRHDALRARFAAREDGSWEQHIERAVAPVPLEVVDLPAGSAGPAAAHVERMARELHAGLDLGAGPVLRAALFRGGAQEPDQLLLVAHHLVVDGVSWGVLLEDLAADYAARIGGGPPPPSEKGTSLRQWAERLSAFARAPEADAAAARWRAALAGADVALPSELRGEPDPDGPALRIESALDPALTLLLLRELPDAVGATTEDLLLAALGRALSPWAGTGRLAIDVETHGRFDELEEFDVSRTVGFFTAVVPVVLDLSRDASPPAEARRIRRARAELLPVSLAYGALAHPPDPAHSIGIESEICFNYLGTMFAGSGADLSLGRVVEYDWLNRDPLEIPPYALEIDALVREERLCVAWVFRATRFRRHSIERLAQRFHAALENLAEAHRTGEAQRREVGDFELIELDAGEADRLEAQIAAVDAAADAGAMP